MVDTDAGFLRNLFSVTFSVDLHDLIGLLAVFIDIHVDGLYICLSLCFRNCDINKLYLKKATDVVKFVKSVKLQL